MNITRENIDELNAVLNITISPEDYQSKVEASIRNHQKKAKLAGFRPGKVPAGVIKKMYGRSILAEELNKVLGSSIDTYIGENKIDILGNPLPKGDAEDKNNWEEPGEFNFSYELGLAPELKLNIDSKKKFDYPTLKVDAELLEKYVADIQRRNGNYSRPEISDAACILYGKFDELEADGNIKEGGHTTTTTVAIELVSDDAVKASMVGLSIGSHIDFTPSKAINNESEVKAMLSLSDAAEPAFSSNYRFTVQSINKIEKAELNTELFDKLYGEGVVTTLEQFQEKVKEEVGSMFSVDADRVLRTEIEKFMLESVNPKLPDSFLKRWLQMANEKPVTAEQIEEEYDNYAKSIKMRLIENRILIDNDLKITEEEIREFARQLVRNQFAQYGQTDIPEEQLTELANRYLNSEERIRQVQESLAGRKVFEYLKSLFTLDKKEMAYDDFIAAVRQGKN